MRAIQTHRRSLSLYVASAPADDDEGIMLIICSLIPSPEYLRATVEYAASSADLDEETETVHFVRQMGQDIVISWIPGLTTAHAVRIRAACKLIKRWSVEAFTTAVGRALDAQVTRVQ
jgi:hypothetical protein